MLKHTHRPNDIVVEFGSGRYKETMDRFVSGVAIPHSELRKVWENTPVSGSLWEKPIYEEFFRAVRDLNAHLPKSKRVRVLLGDLPVDLRKHSLVDRLQ